MSDTQKQIDTDTEEEAKRKRLNQYWKDIAKKKQELKLLEQQARMEASTPESKQRGKDMTVIVKKKQKTVLDNEVTNENADIVLKLNTTQEEEDLYKQHKNKPMYCTKELLVDLKEHSVFNEMKSSGGLDLRKQRHKKTPASYLTGITDSKRILDLEKRVQALEQHNKLTTEVSKKNIELVEKRFETVGIAIANLQAQAQIDKGHTVTLEDKLDFLESLGVDKKKISLYRTIKVYPELTKQQVGNVHSVTRKTVYNWVDELDKILIENQRV